jgi:amidohydrolase
MDQQVIRVSREDATPPHVTLVTARLVAALYDAIEEEIAGSRYPVVYAVGSMSATQSRRGPADSTIELRVATYEPEVRKRLLTRVEAVCGKLAQEHSATCSIDVQEATAPIVNDDHVGETVAGCVRELLGEQAVVQDFRHNVPDDFSLLQEKAPGAQILFGTANAAKGITAMWHTPEYDADEEMLQAGAQVMAASVLRLLE